ncbi:MAG: hypothetical protein QOC85_1203 [Streptomyces sp.]|jgi:hypothetical protein|nr:hypothetical protein [Streptomyces sp.]
MYDVDWTRTAGAKYDVDWTRTAGAKGGQR